MQAIRLYNINHYIYERGTHMADIIERNRLQDKMLKERLETVIPKIMKETGTEFWIIASREYNEDPVFSCITPTAYPTARRISIFVFAQKNGFTDCISLCMPDESLKKYYRMEYDRTKESQMEALERVIRQYEPTKISVDISENYACCDGLSVGLYRKFMKELPEDITKRFVSAEDAVIRLIETRTRTEIKYYPEICNIAVDIIAEAFSEKVIQPGITTCNDVVNFMKRKVNKAGLTTWFDPTIDLQNEKGMAEGETVIQKGDLVHCDFGIVCMGLHTDMQKLCYILKDNEKEAPYELQRALKRNNAFQDIVRSCMKEGKSGNEVFFAAVQEGKKEGLRPVLYTHPLGLFGHSCGPTIGLWTNQNAIYPAGENKIHNCTAYALELSVIEYLEMYQRDTYIFTEESVLFENNYVRFLNEGREKLYTVGGNRE